MGTAFWPVGRLARTPFRILIGIGRRAEVLAASARRKGQPSYARCVPFDRCEAFTKKGDRCQNGSVTGTRYCGPHQDELSRGRPRLADRCEALTSRGEPCRGGIVPGEKYCGPHLDKLGRSERSTADEQSSLF